VCGVIARLGQHLTTLDLITLDTTQQQPTLSPAMPSSSVLLNISTPVHKSSCGFSVQADDLDLFTDLDHATLDTPVATVPRPFDREHVLNRHQERLVLFTGRLRNVLSMASINSPMHFLASRVLLGFLIAARASRE
jgi:hypothetical protein